MVEADRILMDYIVEAHCNLVEVGRSPTDCIAAVVVVVVVGADRIPMDYIVVAA